MEVPEDSGLHFVAIAELHEAPWNPRVISDEQRTALGTSLQHFGAVDPAVVRRSDGLIVGGHQRVMVAREDLDWWTFPVVYVEGSDDEMKALNIALNKISGTWEMDKLAALLDELNASDLDVTLSGFATDEVEKLLDSLHDDAPGEFPHVNEDAKNTCPRCGYVYD